MGLISFVKTAGRKVGLFGGHAAARAEAAAEAAKVAAAAAAAAEDETERLALQHQAVAADMAAAVSGHGIVIEHLTVAFDGETATVRGVAPSQESAEKAVLIVGNTEGCGAVDDQITVEIPAPPAVYHTVVAGDTLSKIAAVHYGSIRMYGPIFEANRPMLEHPDEIYPGQVLRIPPLSESPVHTVSGGETLGVIAKYWYGDASRYIDIFEANRDILSSPDRIEVGQRLSIPLKLASLA